jgi:putative hydrolase of the HAD superfamily
LSGHALGVITNGNTEQQRKKLKTLGLTERLSMVVTSEEAGVAKPDPRIFRRASEQAAVKPTHCYYVGDRLDTDAQAAAQAGFSGIWLNRKGVQTAVDGIRTICDLSALKTIIT